MTWEYERHDWKNLRGLGPSEHVPSAITRLCKAESPEDAEAAYWQIDNTVIVQGALYESALATVLCLLNMLPRCTDAGRPYLLELLVQIGSGEPSTSEHELGNVDLADRCSSELVRASANFFALLEGGTFDERVRSIDLLGICAEVDTPLRLRVLWYFERLLAFDSSEDAAKLTRNWIDRLKSEAMPKP